MRKLISLAAFLLFYASMINHSLQAQQVISGNFISQDPHLTLVDFSVTPEFVTFEYTIPFGGLVDVRIMDSKGKLVYSNQKLNEAGENKYQLNSKAFRSGEHYTIQFDFKLDHIVKDVILPGSWDEIQGENTYSVAAE